MRQDQRTEDRGPATGNFDFPRFLVPEGGVVAQPVKQGNWYALDERLFKKRIERLAELAGVLDFTKAACPDDEQRRKLEQAVGLMHDVAEFYSTQHGWDLYADERSDSPAPVAP